MLRSINKFKITSLLLPLTFVCFSHQVSAVSCTAGAVTATNDTISANYTDCIGSNSGNDVGNGTLLADLNSGDVFDEAGGWFEFTGDITASEAVTGSWTVNGLTSDTFVVSIKASNNFSAYFFDDIGFTATGGTFNTYGIDTNGNNPFAALSHISVYERVSAVPIPGAALLFGSAILGMFGFSLRKKTKLA